MHALEAFETSHERHCTRNVPLWRGDRFHCTRSDGKVRVEVET